MLKGSDDMFKCPCHKCERRHIGCHADCEKYDKYKTENAEIMKELKKAKDDIYYSQKYRY